MVSIQGQARPLGSGPLFSAHPAAPKGHGGMDMNCPVLVRESPSRRKSDRESRRKQIPGTQAVLQRDSFPSHRDLFPDITLAAHVKTPKVTQRWQQNDQEKGKEGNVSLTGVGAWLGMECGLTVCLVGRCPPWLGTNQSGVNVSTAWQGALRGKHVVGLMELLRLTIQWLPK